LSQARLSVSQAGYNTVGDIMVAGCRSVLVPFASGGETEQAVRAGRLARLGRATVVPETALTPASLARAIGDALAAPPPAEMPVNLDGARATAAQVRALVAARTD
jgi:predicted glycosyltransferase